MTNVLDQLTGTGVRVAVVDSGIDFSHPKIDRAPSGVRLRCEAGRVIESDDFGDFIGHGTACAGIIRRRAPEATLVSVRIFDRSLHTLGHNLVAAIRWCVENSIDVVNLSLGTTDLGSRDFLFDACQEAEKAGLSIIAAYNNEDQESFPAVFSNVIGVAGGRFSDSGSYHYRPLNRIECIAHGDLQRVCWLNSREMLVRGTSYAAAHISGVVALIHQAHPDCDLNQAREMLERHTIPEDGIVSERMEAAPGFNLERGGGQIRPVGQLQPRKAALYPYNKEMHAFVRYPELIGFEVSGIADPAGRGLVGRDAGEAIGVETAGVRIQPRLVDSLAHADTLILGYVDELSRIAGRDVLRESVETALNKGLNVFSFHPVPPEKYGDLYRIAGAKNLKITYPWLACDSVRTAIADPNRYGQVQVPVLAVCGTGPGQGKFTAQLALRRAFLKRGYRVGQLGTEHHSELFGFDAAFPMGYASPLEMPVQFFAPFLDFKMREIAHFGQPDIIIAGSQSGTIPYDIGLHDTHTLASIAFLFGIKPDGCALVVNSIDSDAYIRDTMDALRTLVKVPTLLLAMSDKEKHVQTAYGRTWIKPRQLSRSEICDRLRSLEDSFSLPAFEITNAHDQDGMADAVVEYFEGTGPGEPCLTAAA
jgi:uncharacterized NAD-dependent epimerase/dehydratase family protein